MNTYTLRNYVDRYGQVKTGLHLGVTQMAISKALKAGREITITVHESGRVEAFEVKPFPPKQAKRTMKN